MDIQETFKGNLGPLEPILQDPEVTEILVDGPDQITVVRRGKLEDIDARFDDAEHLLRAIRAIVESVGQPVDESHPIVDVRLFDGSLVTAVIHPISLDGPALVIRKFRKLELTFDDLVHYDSLSQNMVAFLRACILGGVNILVAGGSGAGKTTLMNLIAALIPDDERIITIENASELQLHRRRIVRLESRPPNLAGKGAISVADLVLQALKMRPERLIVGELRGIEVCGAAGDHGDLVRPGGAAAECTRADGIGARPGRADQPAGRRQPQSYAYHRGAADGARGDRAPGHLHVCRRATRRGATDHGPLRGHRPDPVVPAETAAARRGSAGRHVQAVVIFHAW